MHALSWFALALWVSALLNTIINLLILGRLRKARLEVYPLVSLIVPARNEERAIERSVRALLAQDYPQFEVVVVDDRSADATGAILDAIAREDPRLIVVHGEEPPEGWLGKPWAMHEGSLRARGELLLFVDADVLYAPSTVTTAVEQMHVRHLDMIFLYPHFEMRGFWENALMPAVPMTPYSFPVWLGEYVHHGYLGIGGGTGNLIRRDVYREVSGHEALRDAVIDDVGLAQHVRHRGFRTGMARTEKLVSVRMYHGFSEVVNGFTKNFFSVLGKSYVLAVLMLAIFVIVHLLPYVFALSGDRIAVVVIGLILLTRVIFFASMRYPIWAALFLHPFLTIGWIWILIRSTWLTGFRGQLSWRGRTYDTARTRFGAGR